MKSKLFGKACLALLCCIGSLGIETVQANYSSPPEHVISPAPSKTRMNFNLRTIRIFNVYANAKPLALKKDASLANSSLSNFRYSGKDLERPAMQVWRRDGSIEQYDLTDQWFVSHNTTVYFDIPDIDNITNIIVFQMNGFDYNDFCIFKTDGGNKEVSGFVNPGSWPYYFEFGNLDEIKNGINVIMN